MGKRLFVREGEGACVVEDYNMEIKKQCYML